MPPVTYTQVLQLSMFSLILYILHINILRYYLYTYIHHNTYIYHTSSYVCVQTTDGIQRKQTTAHEILYFFFRTRRKQAFSTHPPTDNVYINCIHVLCVHDVLGHIILLEKYCTGAYGSGQPRFNRSQRVVVYKRTFKFSGGGTRGGGGFILKENIPCWPFRLTRSSLGGCFISTRTPFHCSTLVPQLFLFFTPRAVAFVTPRSW